MSENLNNENNVNEVIDDIDSVKVGDYVYLVRHYYNDKYLYKIIKCKVVGNDFGIDFVVESGVDEDGNVLGVIQNPLGTAWMAKNQLNQSFFKDVKSAALADLVRPEDRI